MSGLIEIVIAIIVITVLSGMIFYVSSFFSFMPTILIIFLGLFISLNIILFIIHRK